MGIKNTLSDKGFTRVQIVDQKTGKIEGDSGWHQNMITNYGFDNCIVACPIGESGSIVANWMGLGSGSTAIASDATNLNASLGAGWWSTAAPTIVATLTGRLIQSFSSTDAVTIKEIGMKSVSNGSLICANTFASSALATTQSVNCTYDLVYSRV